MSSLAPVTRYGPGAAPATIRDALLAEDRSAFDTAYQRALAAARENLDLTELLQRDPDRFASVARRAAERLTGQRRPLKGTAAVPRP